MKHCASSVKQHWQLLLQCEGPRNCTIILVKNILWTGTYAQTSHVCHKYQVFIRDGVLSLFTTCTHYLYYRCKKNIHACWLLKPFFFCKLSFIVLCYYSHNEIFNQLLPNTNTKFMWTNSLNDCL